MALFAAAAAYGRVFVPLRRRQRHVYGATPLLGAIYGITERHTSFTTVQRDLNSAVRPRALYKRAEDDRRETVPP